MERMNKLSLKRRNNSDDQQTNKKIKSDENEQTIDIVKKSEETEKEIFNCHFCRKDITHMNMQRRLQHINRCADESAQINDSAPLEFQCPFCRRNIASDKKANHLKSCARLNGVTDPEKIVQVSCLIDRQAAERRALGLPTIAAPPKPRTKSINRNKGARKVDPDIQLAMAMSKSLEEEKQRQFENELRDLGIPVASTSKLKRKNFELMPVLMTTTEEERTKIIENKISQLLEEENEVKNILTFEDIMGIKRNNYERIPTKQSLKENRGLWRKAAHSDLGDYKKIFYVSELREAIIPCTVVVGSKRKRYSQIPGREATQVLCTEDNNAWENNLTGNNQEEPFDEDGGMINNPPDNEEANQSGFFTKKFSDEQVKRIDSLLSHYGSMVGNSELSDIQICTKDCDLIPAHKFVFRARCPSLYEESKDTQIIDWPTTSLETAKIFLTYLYTAKMHENVNNICEELASLAEKYDVGKVFEFCKLNSAPVETFNDSSCTLLLSDIEDQNADEKQNNLVSPVEEPNNPIPLDKTDNNFDSVDECMSPELLPLHDEDRFSPSPILNSDSISLKLFNSQNTKDTIPENDVELHHSPIIQSHAKGLNLSPMSTSLDDLNINLSPGKNSNSSLVIESSQIGKNSPEIGSSDENDGIIFSSQHFLSNININDKDEEYNDLSSDSHDYIVSDSEKIVEKEFSEFPERILTENPETSTPLRDFSLLRRRDLNDFSGISSIRRDSTPRSSTSAPNSDNLSPIFRSRSNKFVSNQESLVEDSVKQFCEKSFGQLVKYPINNFKTFRVRKSLSQPIMRNETLEKDVWQHFDDNGYNFDLVEVDNSKQIENAAVLTPAKSLDLSLDLRPLAERIKMPKKNEEQKNPLLEDIQEPEIEEIVHEKPKVAPVPSVAAMQVDLRCSNGNIPVLTTRRKRAKPAAPKRKGISASQPVGNLTPKPNFIDMNTPQIKEQLKKFGIRQLPRKKAVQILDHIYEGTHPLVTDSEHEVSVENHSVKDGLSSSPTKSCSESEENLEETFCLDDSTDEVNESFSDKFKQFIQSEPDLHRKILLYEPIPLQELHSQMKDSGFKIKLATLKEILDKECITFTLPRENRQRGTRRKKKL